ncbi:MAG: hypothetical protein JKX69_06075 [Rhodobacteraceae bacterium]|nr:hypothetical protein [Paracoccaceae bacterium]
MHIEEQASSSLEPLKIFVHSPKAAGSSFNDQLLRHYGQLHSPKKWSLVSTILPIAAIENPVIGRWLARNMAAGCSHIEIYRNKAQVYQRIIEQSIWVSGHVRSMHFEQQLAASNRPFELFALVRDPTEQIASHYQWWIEIHDRGPLRFYRYSAFFRQLSHRIRHTNNSDPAEIIPILRLHHTLFLNMQSDYILRGGAQNSPAPEPADLARFTSIKPCANSNELFASMTGEAPSQTRRQNKSRSSFDRSVFYTDQMQSFLQEYHTKDFALYDLVMNQ